MSDDQLAGFIDAEYPRLIGALGFYVRDRGVAEELAQAKVLGLLFQWAVVDIEYVDEPSPCFMSDGIGPTYLRS